MARGRMRAALIALLGLAGFCVLADAVAAQERTQPRLPPEIFDVIPPAERVTGARGDFQPYQTACRIGPTEQSRRRIVDIAAQEWAAFGFQIVDRAVVESRHLPEGLVAPDRNPELAAPRAGAHVLRGGVREQSPRAAADIAGYWTAAPDSARALARQNAAWNGPGGEAVLWLEPWSAVFVSWVMCEAGLGDPPQFARDISHRVYIDQAIRARDGLAPEAAYEAFDAGEAEILPGDLLCNARGRTGYRSLADRRPDMDQYAPTHCDIVVRVDASAGRILVIGGNVEDSVTLVILPATRDGAAHLRPVGEADLDGARTVFAHLRLRAPAIEHMALDNTPTIRALGARD